MNTRYRVMLIQVVALLLLGTQHSSHIQSYTMSSIAELHPVERHVLQATTMSLRNTVMHCHTVTVLIDLELVFRDKF